ncbi:hypothetical protein C0431_12975 [bacterium]|nr:hypothetical protein [bacterium]
MECVIRDCSGKPYDLKYIKSTDLIEEGVIKRYDATQKAERWFNTEEGKRWIASATDYKDVLLDKIKTLHDNFSNQRETRY